MDQIGQVVSLVGTEAIVDVRRTSACGDKCGSCKGACSIPATRIKISNTHNAKIGDYVEISMETKSVLLSACIVYILPLISMLIGITGGVIEFKKAGFENYEALGFAIGVVSLFISFYVLRIIDNKLKKKGSLVPKMVRIL